MSPAQLFYSGKAAVRYNLYQMDKSPEDFIEQKEIYVYQFISYPQRQVVTKCSHKSLFNHCCIVIAIQSTSYHVEQYILRNSPVYSGVIWKSLTKNSQWPFSKFPFSPKSTFLLMNKFFLQLVMESLHLDMPLGALNHLCRVLRCFLSHLKL